MQDVEDPFYVVDLGRIVELHTEWTRALPSVRPFYAVKCNEDPALLKTLAALGTGFDCASKVRLMDGALVGGWVRLNAWQIDLQHNQILG